VTDELSRHASQAQAPISHDGRGKVPDDVARPGLEIFIRGGRAAVQAK
jgi:hypothetical protein